MIKTASAALFLRFRRKCLKCLKTCSENNLTIILGFVVVMAWSWGTCSPGETMGIITHAAPLEGMMIVVPRSVRLSRPILAISPVQGGQLVQGLKAQMETRRLC